MKKILFCLFVLALIGCGQEGPGQLSEREDKEVVGDGQKVNKREEQVVVGEGQKVNKREEQVVVGDGQEGNERENQRTETVDVVEQFVNDKFPAGTTISREALEKILKLEDISDYVVAEQARTRTDGSISDNITYEKDKHKYIRDYKGPRTGDGESFRVDTSILPGGYVLRQLNDGRSDSRILITVERGTDGFTIIEELTVGTAGMNITGTIKRIDKSGKVVRKGQVKFENGNKVVTEKDGTSTVLNLQKGFKGWGGGYAGRIG